MGLHDGAVRRASWLNRTVVVLTLVSLTQDAASELLYPLLPVLLTSVLNAPAAVVGVIEGTAEAAAGLAKLVAGRLSDRLGRKPVTGAGYAMAALGKVIVAAAGAWPIVLVGRVTDRLGKGTRSAARDAWLASSVDAPHLGRAFGFHRMGDTIGAVIGPLLGLAMLQLFHGDVRHALWIAVIPAALSAALVACAPEHRSRIRATVAHAGAEPSAEVETDTIQAAAVPTPATLGKPFWRVAITLGAVAIVNFPDALLLLRLHDLGWSTSAILIAYVAYNLVYTLASYPAGALSDRISPASIYAIGLAFFGLAYLGLGTVAGDTHSVATWALLALYGLFPACTDGVGKAWISSLVPDAVRGRAQGYFQAIGNGAVFTAGLWAGLVWTSGSGSGSLPLVISGIGGLTACAWMLTAGRQLQRLR
jgi:MFS family permease